MGWTSKAASASAWAEDSLAGLGTQMGKLDEFDECARETRVTMRAVRVFAVRVYRGGLERP